MRKITTGLLSLALIAGLGAFAFTACAEDAEVTLHSTADRTVTFGPGALGCAARAHHARFSRSSPVRLTGQPLVVLRLERGGSIEGVVTDPSGLALRDGEVSVVSFEPGEEEQPLAGSSLELVLPLGREFRLSGLAPGAYVLAVFRHARRGQANRLGGLCDEAGHR